MFADTSALVALRDGSDASHGKATAWLEEALASGGVELVLTNYVLSEVHAFFCRAPRAASAYAKRLREDRRFRVVRASADDEAAAWSLLERMPDKTFSFVDAVSFIVMRRMGLAEALATDRHFRQAGFSIVP